LKKLLLISLIVSFLLCSFITPVQATSPTLTLYETYTAGGDGDSASIYGVNYGSMQITTNATTHSIARISLPLKRSGTTPGTITVSIQKCDSVTHLPDGIDLTSGTLNGNSITTSYVFYPINVTEFTPEASTEYSIITSAISGDAGNYILWHQDTGGGLADAVSATSVDAGLTWTPATAPATDYLFSIYGYSSLSIISAKVFSDYIADGDLLFTAECINTYEPYNSNGSIASNYFQFRLYGVLGLVELASSSFAQFGDAPESIYLSAAASTGLTSGSAYVVKIYGLFSPNPIATYTLQPSDWLGSNKAALDNWVLNTAANIGKYYTTSTTTVTLTDYVQNYGQQLNTLGTTFFSAGIPSLIYVRPNLIENAVYQPVIDSHTPIAGNLFNSASDYTTILGSTVAGFLDDSATIVGLPNGKDFGAFVGFAVYLIVAIFMFGKGQFTAGLGLAFPILGLDAYFRLLDIMWVVGLVVIFVGLFIWSFWWTRT